MFLLFCITETLKKSLWFRGKEVVRNTSNQIKKVPCLRIVNNEMNQLRTDPQGQQNYTKPVNFLLYVNINFKVQSGVL